MKNESLLTKMSFVQEKIHEAEKKENPHLHWLMKDSYDKVEMDDMCVACADHYEWNKKLEYDARTNRFYKLEKKK